jgi:cysteine desulfurase family protein
LLIINAYEKPEEKWKGIMEHIYMDNGSTSFPKAPGLGKTMGEHIDQYGLNMGRGGYSPSFHLEQIAVETKEKLTEFFHGPTSRNVIFTSGATAGLNMIINGLLEPGDKVVTTSLEHNAVARPLYALSQKGVLWEQLPAAADGSLRMDAVSDMLSSDTRLLIATHASNVSGNLTPLQLLSDICKDRQILFVVDAAQTAGSQTIDMADLGLDGLVVPGHKGLLGPQGIGAMLLSDRLAAQLRPTVFGGTGSRSDLLEMPDFLPDRFEPGTLNIPGIVGMNHALDFLMSQGIQSIRGHKEQLAKQFLEGLSVISHVRCAGPDAGSPRESVFSLVFKTVDQGEAAYLLEREHGILTRSGLHCAPLAHQALGTFPVGSVRFSFGPFTTKAEVDACLAAIAKIAKG